MKKVNNLALVIAVICLYSFPHLAKAQNHGNGNDNYGNGNNGNGNNGNGNGNGGSSSVPIDGGLSILAIAGVAYAVKKSKELKNNKVKM